MVELTSGASHLEENVDGRLPYGDLYRTLAERYSTEGGIRQITFLDSSTREEALSSGSHAVAATATASDEEEGSAGADVVPAAGHPLQRNMWAQDRAVGRAGPSTSRGAPALWGREMLMQPFEDVTGTFLTQWHAYKKRENPHRLLLRDRHTRGSSAAPHAAAAGAGGKDKYARMMEVNEVKATIASLQRRVFDLKQERRQGTRDIDDIESDIARTQREITHLQRTYLNWFYYF